MILQSFILHFFFTFAFATLLTFKIYISQAKYQPVPVTLNFCLGAYAPVTMDGNIVVNGILASCYASITSHDLAQLVMKPLQRFPILLERIFGIDNGSPNIVRIIENLGNMFLPDRMSTFLMSN